MPETPEMQDCQLTGAFALDNPGNVLLSKTLEGKLDDFYWGNRIHLHSASRGYVCYWSAHL